jgi:hypothetical protein
VSFTLSTTAGMLPKLSIAVAFGLGAIVTALIGDLQDEALEARKNASAMSALDILAKGITVLSGRDAIGSQRSFFPHLVSFSTYAAT